MNPDPTKYVSLAIVASDQSLSGYYLDFARNLYSTKSMKAKEDGVPTRLKGTSLESGEHFYRLTLPNSHIVKYTAMDIARVCARSQVFQDFFNATKEKQVEQKQGQFIVGSQSGTFMSIAPAPVIHKTDADARAEAERLAKVNQGRTFVVLQVVGRVVASGVRWTD